MPKNEIGDRRPILNNSCIKTRSILRWQRKRVRFYKNLMFHDIFVGYIRIRVGRRVSIDRKSDYIHYIADKANQFFK